MKTFLRDNPTIAYGLGLPLALVLAFLLISGVPSLLVAPPQYDVLYTTGNRNQQNDLQIYVVDKKVQVIHQVKRYNNSYGNQQLRLWRYNSKSGAVQEIAIILPAELTADANRNRAAGDAANEETAKATVIDVPDLDGLQVDSSSIAPDGYEFNAGLSRNSGNVFGGLFYSRRYDYKAKLEKNGRNIRLPNTVGRYYGRTAQFVGWVVAE